MLARHFILALLLVLALAGCVGTAVPQPPNQDPIDPLDLLTPEEVESTLVEYRGGPGTVEGGAQVWLVNLERSEDQAVSLAEGDGSFRIGVSASNGDVLRLSYRTAAGHSEPLDLFSPDTRPVVRPACLRMALDLSLGVDRTAALAIDNDCEGEVTLSAFRLRRDAGALGFEAPDSVSLPSGTRFELVVSAAGVDPVEDHLFVFAAVDGSTVRYPVSVHVE